jgi:RNA-binding protein
VIFAKSIYTEYQLIHKHTDRYIYENLHYAQHTGDLVLCLGQVKGIGYHGKLIVKGKFAPELSTKVMDKSLKVIGTVSRVFGPVDSPYISVKPLKDRRPSIESAGIEVYVEEKIQ